MIFTILKVDFQPAFCFISSCRVKSKLVIYLLNCVRYNVLFFSFRLRENAVKCFKLSDDQIYLNFVP